MAKRDPEPWRFLLAPEAGALRDAVRDVGVEAGPGAIERLRKAYPGQPVTEALELVAAQQKARRKFPDPERLLCDRQGVEQATSHRVAEYKARRFGDVAVTDICCGIGGDAMSLARRGETFGVDACQVRSVMCAHNAGIEVRCRDATGIDLDTPLVHVDPARRDEATGRRSWRLSDLRPGIEVIETIIERSEGAAVKFGPGIPRDLALPDPSATIEFIADDRALVQAVAWCGSLASPGMPRRATDVAMGMSIEGTPGSPGVRSSTGSHLLVPHPAIERAQLVSAALGTIDAGELAPGLGILTADHPVESPWLETFEILNTLPPRRERVQRWLEEHGAGTVVVRSRDQAIDADSWSRNLQGRGEREVVLHGLRLRKKVVVFATRRVVQPGSSAS